ncbi:ficolin-2-like [Mixophyes fleayi]|uniref:ficolin-2-like n=1 Tax=Mixophyes fleayi TaxID=3061075 RepID=UPI003F4D9DFF
MVTTLSNAEDTCPEVKIVGVGDSDTMTIIRGCPGISGPAGQKGETGIRGMKGQPGPKGYPGKAGPTGIKGQQGSKGDTGLTGSQGPKGDSGERIQGEKGEGGVIGSQASYDPRSCKELKDKGHIHSDWYTIYPDGSKLLKVLCDMDTDGGGWIVFQRRWDGSVDFYRDWKSYKTGFGSRLNEFWLGNDNLHWLTSSGRWEMQIDLYDFKHKKVFAKYSSFKVLGESDKYMLLLGNFTDGNIGDAMAYHRDRLFTTFDQDNDGDKDDNCAKKWDGAWWFSNCYHANLNSVYKLPTESDSFSGINWKSGKEWKYYYKYTEMKMRPV